MLDKPSGISSNAALQRAKWLFRAQKAGHTGTLDPLASGLLPLCFGEATKFAQFLLDAEKRYLATITFGAMTTTGDAEGEITTTHPVDFTSEALLAILAGFVGTRAQVPPAYAALKFEGRKYYEYARAGIEIPRAPRAIEIRALTLARYVAPTAEIEVLCTKGTYVRVLAEDVGRALGCGAYLSALRRTQTGGFRLDGAVGLDALATMDDAQRDALLLPLANLVADLPVVRIDTVDARRFQCGAVIAVAEDVAQGTCAVFEGTTLLGVANVASGLAQPRRVVAPQGALNP